MKKIKYQALKIMIFSLFFLLVGIMSKTCNAATNKSVNLGEASVKAKKITKEEKEKKKLFKSAYTNC